MCKKCWSDYIDELIERDKRIITQPELSLMEYVCGDLCRYPREVADQKELDVICGECKLGDYVCGILNRGEVTSEAAT